MTENQQASVEEAIAAIAAGDMIVVVDDDDRENEGDLIMAAHLATPEKVAFMIRHTSGILCVPMTPEDARRLRLEPMVADNDAPLSTAFTVSVDYRPGLTTGISAEERCATIRALANPNAGASEFARPGHIFPLIAKPGGVLMRSGHTEAAVDMVRAAGLSPVGLISELVNDDGSVKKGQEVTDFAAEHNLKLISVAALIDYRRASEKLVTRVKSLDVDTSAGKARGYVYCTPFDELEHLALVFGRVGDGKSVLTRLHREDTLADVFGGRPSLDAALSRISDEKRGVLVYLREGGAGVPSMGLGRSSDAEPGANSTAARDQQWRDVGLGAQILRDLGVRSIRLLASKDFRYVGLEGFGISIESTERLSA